VNIVFVAFVLVGFISSMIWVWSENGPAVPIIIMVIGLITAAVAIAVLAPLFFIIMMVYGAISTVFMILYTKIVDYW